MARRVVIRERLRIVIHASEECSTRKEISEKTGLDYGVACMLIKRAGIYIPKETNRGRLYGGISKFRNSLIGEGWGIGDIRRMEGQYLDRGAVSRQAIFSHIRDYGLYDIWKEKRKERKKRS